MLIRFYDNPFQREPESIQVKVRNSNLVKHIPERLQGEQFTYFFYSVGRVEFANLVNMDATRVSILTITRKVEGGGKLGKLNFRTFYAVVTFGMSEVLRWGYRQFKSFMSPKVQNPTGLGGGAGTQGGAGGSTTTYGWEGIQTLANAGIPVPILWGKHALGGNLINVYTRNIGENSTIFALIALCEGPITSIANQTEDTDNANLATVGDSLLIENIPANEIEGLVVGVRLGDQTQSAFPGFSVLREQIPFNVPIQLTYNNPVTFVTDHDDVTELNILFQHNGLTGIAQNGGLLNFTYRARIEYRVFASGDAWQTLGTYVKDGATTSQIQGEFNTGNFPFNPLTGKKYEIRVTQLVANTDIRFRLTDTSITTRIEGRDLELSYPRTALIALQIPAGDKVSGRITDIRVVCEGLEVLVVDEEDQSPYRAYSNNPIFCLADSILNPLYGVGNFAENTFDWNQLLEEALIFQPEEGPPLYEMNAVVDYEAAALDVINELATNFRINVYYDGTRILMKVRRDKPISYVINMSNIKAMTFSQSSTPFSATPNYFTIEYNNEEKNYDRDFFTLEDEDLLLDGRGVVRMDLQSRAMTNEQQVSKFANYLRKVAKNVIQSVEFVGFVDVEKMQIGEVVELQQDITGYGVLGGRLVDAGVNWIEIDKNIETVSGDILLFVIKNYLDEIQFVEVDTLQFNITPATPFVIDAGTRMTLRAAFIGTTPRTFDLYNMGVEDEGVTPTGKKYYVESVTFLDNGEVQVSMTEHYAELYDDSLAAFDPIPASLLPNPLLPPAPVNNLTATSEPSYYPIVRLSWEIPVQAAGFGFHGKSQVFWSEDGGENFVWGGETRGNTLRIYDLAPAKKYVFRVLTINTLGILSEVTREIEYTPQPAKPGKVKGIRLVSNSGGITFSAPDAEFAWVPTSTIPDAGDNAGNEPLGASTGNRPEYIRGYEVSIYNPDDPLLRPNAPAQIASSAFRRREIVTENRYNYLFARNQTDQTGFQFIPSISVYTKVFKGPLRNILIGIRALDKFGQLGEESFFWCRNDNAKIPTFDGVTPFFGPFNDAQLYDAFNYGDSFQTVYDASDLPSDKYSFDGTTFQLFLKLDDPGNSQNAEDFVGYAVFHMEERPIIGSLPATFLGIYNSNSISAVLKLLTVGVDRQLIIKPIDRFDVQPATNLSVPNKVPPLIGIPNCIVIRMDE